MEQLSISYEINPLFPIIGDTVASEDAGRAGILQIELSARSSSGTVVGRGMATLIQDLQESFGDMDGGDLDAEGVGDVLSPGPVLRPNVMRTLGLFSDDAGRDLMILEDLEVLPAFRGFDAGHKMIQACVRHFGRHALITALRAFPLQYENEGHPPWRWGKQWADDMRFHECGHDREASQRRLIEYYRDAGFRVVDPKAALMVRANRPAAGN